MNRYDLAEHFKDEEGINDIPYDKDVTKTLFTDKRLNQLWEKAYKSGFTGEKLLMLLRLLFLV